MGKTYQEPEFPKGSVSSILGSINSDVNPPAKKKPNANGTKKKTGRSTATPKKK